MSTSRHRELLRQWDASLVRVADWREEAFTTFYDRLVRFAYSWCGSHEWAEDLVMDTFCWLYSPEGAVADERQGIYLFLRSLVKYRYFNARRLASRRYETLMDERAWEARPALHSPEEVALAIQTIREAVTMATDVEREAIRQALISRKPRHVNTSAALRRFRERIAKRPTHADTHRQREVAKPRFLAALRGGMSLSAAARSVGRVRIPYLWRDEDPAFAAEWDAIVVVA